MNAARVILTPDWKLLASHVAVQASAMGFESDALDIEFARSPETARRVAEKLSLRADSIVIAVTRALSVVPMGWLRPTDLAFETLATNATDLMGACSDLLEELTKEMGR